MIIDTSAILAVLLGEDDRDNYIYHLSGKEKKLISPFNALEADIVIQARKGEKGHQILERFMYNCDIQVVPFDAAMRRLAYEGWLKFGKGRHPASLNLGDCCSYALSKYMNEPLLFKGNDFTQTDVRKVETTDPRA